jgi:hypothetical protein
MSNEHEHDNVGSAASNPAAPPKSEKLRKSGPIPNPPVQVLVTTNGNLDLPGGASFQGMAGQTLEVSAEQGDFIVSNGLGTIV